MGKKLLVFSLVLAFLVGSGVTAKKSDVGAKQGDKDSKSALLEKRSYVHPRIEKLQSRRTDDAIPTYVKKAEQSAEEVQSAAFGDLEGDAIPVPARKLEKPELIRKQGYLYPGRKEIVPVAQATANGELPHGFLFNYDDETSEYYLSGGIAGDEWGIWFQSPQAACSLYAVDLTFYGGVDGGTILLNVMEAGNVSPDTVANEDSVAVDDIFGVNLMGEDEEFPLEIEATSKWERFVFPDWGYDIDVGRDIFWIHWTKTGEHPMLLADDDNPSDYLHTWDFEPNQDGDWKWSHYGASVGIEAMVRAEVIFYEDPPPTVAGVQANDTYRTDEITLTAKASDNALDPALEGIAEGWLYYWVDGEADTMEATVTGDTAVGFTLTATIPAGATGDMIEYKFGAEDLAGLYSESFPLLSFERTEPMFPDADLLVIRDNVSSRQRDLVEQVLDDNGYVYELWDASDHHGIDVSVIGFGWTNIVMYGWANKTLPPTADEDDPGYADFIDGGGNLILIDMDWFFGHGLEEGSNTFESGDFAFDYFGLTGGENDPGAIDTIEVTGQDVTPIDSPFVTDPLVLRHAPYLLTGGAGWIDYLTVGTGTPIFKDDQDNVVGVAVDHSPGGKAVFLSFMADAAGDTLEDGSWDYSQFATLMDGVWDYFGAVSPPLASVIGKGSTRYGVASGTNSATVNAAAFDGDGTLGAVDLHWIVDDGEEETVAMDLVSGDEYTATIDLTGFTDTSEVEYWIEPTDDDGLSTKSESGWFWGTDFTPSGAEVLYMFDYYGPYLVYGPAEQDSILQANMFWNFDYDSWDVYNDYQADYATVLSNYQAVVYAGVFDWLPNPEESADHTLTEFVDGGGYLLYTSEEVLGTYTDWEDVSFEEGHFAYDVLGVEWVGNDYNYDTVAVDDDGGTGLIFGITTDDIPLDISTSYFGSFADLVDPVGYGTADQLPSPFLGKPGFYYFASSLNSTVVFLAFNVAMLPTNVQQQFLSRFAAWADIAVSVDDVATVLPERFALHQNYPNPFNPSTVVRFELPVDADVKLVAYNLLGQEVSRLVDQRLKAGYHHVRWNGIDNAGKPVSSGVYIYRITAGDFTNTRKMLLLK